MEKQVRVLFTQSSFLEEVDPKLVEDVEFMVGLDIDPENSHSIGAGFLATFNGAVDTFDDPESLAATYQEFLQPSHPNAEVWYDDPDGDPEATQEEELEGWLFHVS